MKNIFKLLGLLFILFISLILVRTFTFSSSQLIVDPVAHVAIGNETIKRFQEALRIETISHEDPSNFDSTAFRTFNSFLSQNFALVDSTLEHQYFNEFSHLYKWSRIRHSSPLYLWGIWM